jgi:hypothetical protein
MKARVLSGSLTAATLAWAVTLSAQSTSQTSQTTTARTGQHESEHAIAITGCVQKETDVLRGSPATGNVGMGDEYVLTRSTLKSGTTASATERSSATGTGGRTGQEATGTSGDSGKVYRVTGDKEGDLKNYVGQQVEIAGRFKHDEDARQDAQRPATSSTQTATGERPDAESVPEITIQTIRPLSIACSGENIK